MGHIIFITPFRTSAIRRFGTTLTNNEKKQKNSLNRWNDVHTNCFWHRKMRPGFWKRPKTPLERAKSADNTMMSHWNPVHRKQSRDGGRPRSPMRKWKILSTWLYGRRRQRCGRKSGRVWRGIVPRHSRDGTMNGWQSSGVASAEPFIQILFSWLWHKTIVFPYRCSPTGAWTFRRWRGFGRPLKDFTCTT